MSRIEWDTPRTSRTLKQLMEKRFAEVLSIPEANAWDEVFDEDEQMPGRQNKYQHMLDRKRQSNPIYEVRGLSAEVVG